MAHRGIRCRFKMVERDWLYCVMLLGLPVGVTGDTGWFWHVTDIHYDFSYWTDMFSCNEKVPHRGIYGDGWCDSPWKLVTDSIDAMARIKPDVDFILWTGDNVAHIPDEHISEDIVTEILKNITDAFKRKFTDISVYATLGNHDWFPHSQLPGTNHILYNRTADLWADWISGQNQLANFRQGGYYTVKTQHGLRIIGLNTNMYYTADKLTVNMTDPAGQFAWMENVLNNAKAQNEKVLITGHVPSGVHTPGNLLWFYPHFNTKFNGIITKYTDVIVGMHFGHDHADEFKIVYKPDGTAGAPLFLAPSITPWRYKIPKETGLPHNPGIRLVTYDRTTGKHLDIHQYYLDLPDSNTKNATDWKLEYNATRAYGIPDVTASSLDILSEKMKTNKSLMDKYIKFRWVMAKPDDRINNCDRKCRWSFLCGFKHYDMDTFQACLDKSVGGSARLSTSPIYFFVLAIILSIFL